MVEFTKDELVSISNVFSQLKFAPGQSKAMATAEDIIKKCNPEQKPVKEGE